ncbi:Tetraspanin-5 [Trachymyrmex zeteki]|uniref:Tetraspanin-5 n=1 Tax=Mycetomoellerius zeteki TaxID=64791 RepID=A0A151XC51_9HYME|nr:Tetraspanin-5 [Trachymyrmex zeteki]
MPAVRKYRRDTSEVSCCLKYVIFGFNVMFWIFRTFPDVTDWLGLGIMAVGVWAWTEKDTFNNLSRLTNVALDPAFILILVVPDTIYSVAGTVTFIIGFTGCVGALRENTCLLAAYAIFLALLLLMEMTVGVLGFIFKDWIKSQATGGFQAFIIHYREDPDQQNLIDWIQEDWLQCCGIEGPKDWDRNNYFNCSSSDIGSREACGVPFSCCKRKPNEIIKNKQCGYDVRKPSYSLSSSKYTCVLLFKLFLFIPSGNFEVAKVIYEKGCIQAGEEWVERNLLAIASGAVGTAFTQVYATRFSRCIHRCGPLHYGAVVCPKGNKVRLYPCLQR